MDRASDPILKTFTAFAGDRRIATGDIKTVALKAQALIQTNPDVAILFFDDELGEVVDVSLRGTPAQLEQRLNERFPDLAAAERGRLEGREPSAHPSRGRGRPKLGVVAREVTLLPRHWEWLNSQPGSASVVLRRLVEEARRTHSVKDRRQKSQRATYLFLSAMGGDRPHFEDAIRALFAGDQRLFHRLIEAWPVDIRRHAEQLSSDAFAKAEPTT
jgi:uncharacterized protein